MLHYDRAIQHFRGRSRQALSTNAFRDITHSGAVVVIEGLQQLLDAHRHPHPSVGIDELLSAIEHCGDVVVLLCSASDADLNKMALHRLSSRISFTIPIPIPKLDTRKALWQRLLSCDMPMSDDIDFDVLARYQHNPITIPIPIPIPIPIHVLP